MIQAIAPGFGNYQLPYGKSFAQMQWVAKVQKIALTILFSIAAMITWVLFPLLVPIPSYFAVKNVVATVGISNQAPPMQAPDYPDAKPSSGFATLDGTESHIWKLNLIRAAKSNILISGCYCGGKAFDELLDLIRDRMRLVPELTASILSSDIFISNENNARIAALKKEFGERFSCFVTPELFPYLSPTTDQLTFSTNHTKYCGIDDGAAFLVGGSGIVSPWSEQRGKIQPKQVEAHGIVYDALNMKAYRDMDFVFLGQNRKVHHEMINLFERFRYTSEGIVKNRLPLQEIEPPNFPDRQKIGALKLTCFATGPENPQTTFLNDLISEVNQAKNNIVIDHMYFHPTKELLQALIEAAKRRVKITLLTNRVGSLSPGSHMTFTELSRYYAKSVPNLELYEYDVPYTTLHKKVIVIDGKLTFVGSANIGHKSLSGTDYELSLKVASEEFANQVTEHLEEDKELCLRDQTPLSLKTRCLACFQSLFTPFL